MILIADDDSDFAENCSMMLESYGYHTRIVSSGEEALARISDRQPELLISECGMPDFSGVQLSEHIKDNPSTTAIPVLLTSGSLRCQAAPGKSYDAFLRKPFLAEDLLVKVRQLLHEGTCAVLPQRVHA